ncbi:hypothetical protein AB3N00_17445 [Paenibacillus xylanilyticus]
MYGHGLILLQDGTLHQNGKQIKGLESIIDVGPYPADGNYSYGTLSASGDVYYADYRNIVRKVGSVENGKAIATNSAYAAVLKNDGSVVIVNMMYEEDQVEVASDVQSMIWLGNTHKLLTVKNDGTVWSYDRTAKYKSEQLSGLTNVKRLEYSFELGELYALLQDGKVQTIGGQTVFPAHLLSQTAGIKVRWDAELKQAEVLVGKSAILIESKDTAALIKKKELGSLSRLIGKSYWINEYTELGQRFSKVTITDIEIDKYDSGDKSYSVVFRNAKGKTIVAYAGGTASRVTEMLSDSDQFFPYDPYQKYKWSQSTWKKIIAGEVALGMTTKQAGLAWGDPTSITQEMSSKGKIEVWVYAGPNLLRVLSFVGGKLISIY